MPNLLRFSAIVATSQSFFSRDKDLENAQFLIIPAPCDCSHVVSWRDYKTTFCTVKTSHGTNCFQEDKLYAYGLVLKQACYLYLKRLFVLSSHHTFHAFCSYSIIALFSLSPLFSSSRIVQKSLLSSVLFTPSAGLFSRELLYVKLFFLSA